VSNKDIPVEVIDKHLDAVLRASGSALKYHTLPQSLLEMRMAMLKAMLYTELSKEPT
jgi:hypothetical protein